MKKRILMVSLICIMLLALVLPLAMSSVVVEAQAPALAVAVAPVLDLAAEGAAFTSVENQPVIPVSAKDAFSYAVGGLILANIVAMVAAQKRRIFSFIGRLFADTEVPGAGAVRNGT